ncbi:MAG: hypothetical protein IK088_05735 [Lachnospiraceae bacterium]|nr:hypothetical protein [Lachnospiraceae bacterium]MBR4768459.1 hypothetical protein [Lachnospiraceae bacterium]
MANGSVRKSRARRRTVILVLIVAAVFVAFFSVKIIQSRKENAELAAEMSRIAESISNAEKESEAIEERKNRELTEDEMIDIARKRFGLLFPNEIIFLPDDQ